MAPNPTPDRDRDRYPIFILYCVAACLIGSIQLSSGSASAFHTLSPGDLLVADSAASSIIRIDPVTGAQTVVSAGGELEGIVDVAITTGGTLLALIRNVANRESHIVQIDPATGVQAPLPSVELPGLLTGAFPVPVGDFAIDENGDIWVFSGFDVANSLIRIDPYTGQITEVSSPGSGYLSSGNDLVVDPSGFVFVIDANSGLIRIDIATGVQAPFGLTPVFGESLAQAPNGDLIVAGTSIFRIDISTQAVTLLPIAGGFETQVVVDAAGDLLITDTLLGTPVIVRSGPLGESPTVIATGAPLTAPVAITRVPEPGPEPHVALEPNAIVVGDPDEQALVLFDSMGGQLLARGGHLSAPGQVLVSYERELFVIDEAFDTLVRVDPWSGNQEVIADGLGSARGISHDSEQILIAAAGEILRVDLESHAVTTVANSTAIPGFVDVGIAPSGAIFALESSNSPASEGRIVEVDPVSGALSELAKRSAWFNAFAFAVEADGNLVISSSSGLERVDALSGAVSTINSSLPRMAELTLHPDGDLLGLELTGNELLRIDPTTGVSTPVPPSGLLSDAAGVAGVPTLLPGDLVVAGDDGVFWLDPDTGETKSLVVPFYFQFAADVVIEEAGTVLVIDIDFQNIVRIDPVTGFQDTVSSDNIVDNPGGLALSTEQQLYVSDLDNGLILEVDPTNGASTPVTSGLGSPLHLAIESDGHLLVASTSSNDVIRVDPDTGVQTALGVAGLLGPEGIAVEADGQIALSHNGNGGQLLRVDPVSGTSSLVANILARSLAIGLDGDWFAAIEGGGVARVDPVTGTSQILDVGMGGEILGIAVVQGDPVPEPALLMGLLPGLMLLGLLARRHDRLRRYP